MDRVDERRQQLAGVVDRTPREERHVDRKIKQDRPACDKSEDVAKPSHDEVLAAARDGIGSGELGVGETYADVDDSGKKKCDVRGPRRPREHEPESDENVRADVGIAPGKGSPRGDAAAKFRLCSGRRRGHLERVSVQVQARAVQRDHVKADFGRRRHDLRIVRRDPAQRRPFASIDGA